MQRLVVVIRAGVVQAVWGSQEQEVLIVYRDLDALPDAEVLGLPESDEAGVAEIVDVDVDKATTEQYYEAFEHGQKYSA